MELDKNGNLANFYKWSYREYHLPQNFCDYFWLLIWAAIFFPITWLSYPLSCWTLTERVFKGFGVLLFLAATAFYISLWIESPFQTFKWSGITVSVCVGVLLFTFGGVALLGWWEDRKAEESDDPPKSILSEVMQMIREKKKSVKDNYCPKIDWI
jgi:hypothetical protein